MQDPTQNQNNTQPQAVTPTVNMPTGQDLPPLPDFMQSNQTTTPVAPINQITDDSAGSSAPDVSSVITSSPKKKFGGGKVIATILGMLLLVGGVGAGLILTQQNQIFGPKASGRCIDNAHCVAGLIAARNSAPAHSSSSSSSTSTVNTAPATTAGGFGWDYSTGAPAGASDWSNLNAEIAGTYVSGNTRYLVQSADTAAAATNYLNGSGGGSSDAVAAAKTIIAPSIVSALTGNSAEACSDRCTGGCSGSVCTKVTTGACANPSSGDVAYNCGWTTGDILANGQIFCSTCSVTNPGGPTICGLGFAPNSSYTGCVSTTTTGCTGGNCGNNNTSSSASCSAVTAYDSTWNALSATQLSALTAGTTVNFCVTGTTTGGGFDMAQFTINGTQQAQTTTKGSGAAASSFCQSYQIPASTYSFSVTAIIHDATLGWSG